MGTMMSCIIAESSLRDITHEVIIPQLAKHRKQIPPLSVNSDKSCGFQKSDSNNAAFLTPTGSNSNPTMETTKNAIEQMSPEHDSDAKNGENKKQSVKINVPTKTAKSTVKSKERTLSLKNGVKPKSSMAPAKRATTPTNKSTITSTGGNFAKISSVGLGKSSMKSKLTKGKSSREILKEALGENGLVLNVHPIEVKALIELGVDCIANFHYSYDPETKTESCKHDCCPEKLDKLKKMDVSLDKDGNINVGQFTKGLIKLIGKYNGTICLNNYQITLDKDPSRRLKINSLDITMDPIIMEISGKGIESVSAHRSATKLELRGDTEFGKDDEKWIRIDGVGCKEIKLIAPEGKAKMFACFPAILQKVVDSSSAPDAIDTISIDPPPATVDINNN